MTERKKNKRPIKNTGGESTPQNRAAQILFVLFAVLIILSMILSATVSY
jgi:uncharacterized membrane protein YtjA (UPF0391 family)